MTTVADQSKKMSARKLPITYLLLLLMIGLQLSMVEGLQTAKQWKLISYNFLPQHNTKDVNFYNPINILITGLAVSRDRIFIATPKLFSGVSSSVNMISKSDFGDSPVLQAYPDWSFSTTGRKDFNCSDLIITSVYRLRIDSCNRLWVLDAGVSRSLEDYEITCPPKILIIDLNTDQVVRRIEFPPEILRGESLFTNLVIDETTSKRGNCDDVFVYITDSVEPAIVVYDSEKDVTWRLTHPAMYPDPDFAQSEILNDRFVLMDGIIGLAFDEKAALVYFQPLATDRVFSITREVLRAGPLPLTQVLPVKLVGRKSSQGVSLLISPIDRSLLFSPLSETAIAAWSPHTNQQSVLAHDRDRLQFVADMSISRDEPGALYMISSKFQRFFLKTLNPNEYNNRILRLDLPGGGGGVGVSQSHRPLPYGGVSLSHGNGGRPLQNSLEPLLHQLPGYAFKPLAVAGSATASSAHGFTIYPPTGVGKYQAHEYYASPSTTSISTLVKSPTGSTQHHHQQHPYPYETTGAINYAIRNPFTALNHGETFPPTKEQRLLYQQQTSFLDGLTGSPTTKTTIPISPLHTNSFFAVSNAGRRIQRNALPINGPHSGESQGNFEPEAEVISNSNSNSNSKSGDIHAGH